jgi:hypothetical protein
MTSKAAASTAGSRLLRLYPAWWRERYGAEMAALLEARPLDARARFDLVRGALDAHLRGADQRAGPGGVRAALIAGGAWTISGVASAGGPTPPDWPGYLASTLPIAFVGALAILVATMGIARLAWPSSSRWVEVAIVAVVVGHLAWAGTLAVAALGGPYGAVTAVAQSLAALATIGLALALLRAGVHPIGEVVVVAGSVMLLPTPAAWVVVGALWAGVGLWSYVETRTDVRPSGAIGR